MSLLKGFFWFTVFVALLLIVGRIFFFEVARTDSYTMVPNILAGDTFLVFTRGTLGPGEVAMCKDPENPGMMVVGRILGVPGSTFAVNKNMLELNDERIQRSFDNPSIVYEDTTGGEESVEIEISVGTEKVGGHVYDVALTDRAGYKSFPRTEVESGFYLVGDNRNRARDSREFGEIPIEDCVGTPFLIIWPGPDSGDFKLKNRFLDWIN